LDVYAEEIKVIILKDIVHFIDMYADTVFCFVKIFHSRVS